jgi:hypothetical protein
MKRLRFLGTSDILLSVRREVPTFMSTLSFVPSVSENAEYRKLSFREELLAAIR